MDHDQLAKTLLQRLFRHFMTLFLPDIAAHLDLSRVEFLAAESFVRPPRGRRKYPDLVAKVWLKGGGTAILVIHLEIQERRDPNLPARMHRYYVVLRERFRCPVLPIALLFHGQRRAAGIGEAVYVEETLGKEYLRFTYHQIVVPRLKAEEYLAQDNPAGLALAARMRRGRRLTGGALVLAVLAKLLDSNLSEEDVLIIWDFVRSYVTLTPEEETTVNEVIERERKRGRRQRLTWSQQERLKGREESRAEAIRVLALQLAQKFGPLPAEMQSRIQSLSLEDTWAALSQVLTAESLADLGLAEEGRRAVPSPAGTA
jgi:hypothetical protein